MKKDQAGREMLRLDCGELRYESRGAIVWRFQIADLRLIGEWTTDHGPWVEDYFYGFAAGHPARWYEAPMGANPEIIAQLAQKLSEPLRLGLIRSTEHKSRVIWPSMVEGRDLFSYSPAARPGGVLNRLKDSLLPMINSDLARDVREYLGSPVEEFG
jgi:hypothetical protein